jgi:hypothetical protein
MANGRTTAHTATRRNHLDDSSFFLHKSHVPHSAKRNNRTAMYAIARIDQYWMKTFGT